MDELELILDMEIGSKERRCAINEYAEKHNLKIKEVLEELIIAQADKENKNEKLISPITFDD